MHGLRLRLRLRLLLLRMGDALTCVTASGDRARCRITGLLLLLPMSIRPICRAHRRHKGRFGIVSSLALRPEFLRRIGCLRCTGAVLLLRPRYTRTVRLPSRLRLDLTLLLLLPWLERVRLRSAVRAAIWPPA